MNDLPSPDPRRRLRELLAIPERDRTDAQWDEIIELEITMAPGNREVDRFGGAGGDRQPDKRPGSSGPGRRPEPRKPGPRPPVNRTEPRPPSVKPDGPQEGSNELRGPRRHIRRPRRPPETPSEG